MNAAPMPVTLRAEDADYTRERYSARQAADYLLMSRASVYELVAEGRLGCRRVNKRTLLFSQADLDKYRESLRQEATVVAIRRAPAPATVRSLTPTGYRRLFR